MKGMIFTVVAIALIISIVKSKADAPIRFLVMGLSLFIVIPNIIALIFYIMSPTTEKYELRITDDKSTKPISDATVLVIYKKKMLTIVSDSNITYKVSLLKSDADGMVRAVPILKPLASAIFPLYIEYYDQLILAILDPKYKTELISDSSLKSINNVRLIEVRNGDDLIESINKIYYQFMSGNMLSTDYAKKYISKSLQYYENNFSMSKITTKNYFELSILYEYIGNKENAKYYFNKSVIVPK